jgi:lysyl-tRNA synthetase class 2
VPAGIVIEFATDVGLGQRAGFVLLVALLLSFLFIRTSARMIRAQVSWWPGNVETAGGLHIHHLVWGIWSMMIAGFLSFALNPDGLWALVLAAWFGIGMGLTLDEFALWLRLEDVYWSQQGRESVDAVVIALVFGGLVVIGLSPFDVRGYNSDLIVSVLVAVTLSLCIVTILKGKLVTGLVGVFVPLVALVGAIRLAEPGSWWARRRYREDSVKLRRAQRRAVKRDRWLTRARNAVAGAPGPQ